MKLINKRSSKEFYITTDSRSATGPTYSEVHKTLTVDCIFDAGERKLEIKEGDIDIMRFLTHNWDARHNPAYTKGIAFTEIKLWRSIKNECYYQQISRGNRITHIIIDKLQAIELADLFNIYITDIDNLPPYLDSIN